MSIFCPVGVRLLSTSEFASPAGMQVISLNKMAAACNYMKKKNWFLLIIILTAVLLIAIVFWIYAKRIEHIESKMIHSRLSAHCVSAPANAGI
jgi:hypothetical protein